MTTQETLGGFQQLVMLAVLRLDDEAYGARIQRDLEETAGRSISISTVPSFPLRSSMVSATVDGWVSETSNKLTKPKLTR